MFVLALVFFFAGLTTCSMIVESRQSSAPRYSMRSLRISSLISRWYRYSAIFDSVETL